MGSRTVLVTGATGFIGGAAVARLLLEHPSCRVLLLVRGDSEDAAAARLRRSVARFVDLAVLEHGLRRSQIICGDLTDVDSLADSRLDEVTHVLHLAAHTSFVSVQTVRRTNTYGTLMLAQRMRRAAGLARFLYVGTAYICGAHPPRVVHEDDYPRPEVCHLVEYTNSKAECEMLLEQLLPELPLVVARPSVVVGHTRLGCLPSASIFWYYRTLNLLRRVPAPLSRLKDIVPVDYTAAALVDLLFKPRLRYRRYHISAGDLAAVSWWEMADEFARYSGARSADLYRVVDFPTLVQERRRLRERLGPGDEDRLLRALELYFRFSACGVEIFDNRRLLNEGFPLPPRFTSYLGACVQMPPDRSVYEQMHDDE